MARMTPRLVDGLRDQQTLCANIDWSYREQQHVTRR